VTWPDPSAGAPLPMLSVAWPPLADPEEVVQWARGDLPAAVAVQAACIATAVVRAYCTAGIPDPAPPAVHAVALMLAVRLAKNPQALRTISVEGQSISPAPVGFTFLESILLNRWRRRAA
jgi:hypothetical protein